jgi:hypothetical protein
MTSAALLVDAFGRIREVVHSAVVGLTADQLAYRPDAEANSIAWLVWHLTRIQDDHIAGAAETEQVWTIQGWAKRFDLPFSAAGTGYGHRPEDVAQLGSITAEQLLGYHDAVYDQTIGFVQGITDSDLERIVDRAWDPPVTLGVRLISIIGDDMQHAGQASYVRGLAERR